MKRKGTVCGGMRDRKMKTERQKFGKGRNEKGSGIEGEESEDVE